MTILVNSSEVSTCFQQRCRECPESAITEPVYETKCEIRSLVSQSWLDLEDHSIPGPQGLEADYACLKLTAYDPTMKSNCLHILILTVAVFIIKFL